MEAAVTFPLAAAAYPELSKRGAKYFRSITQLYACFVQKPWYVTGMENLKIRYDRDEAIQISENRGSQLEKEIEKEEQETMQVIELFLKERERTEEVCAMTWDGRNYRKQAGILVSRSWTRSFICNMNFTALGNRV